MTDLSKGIIDFGEIVVTPTTTKDALIRVYSKALSPVSTDSVLIFNQIFRIGEVEFMPDFWFSDNGTLSSIKLSPCIYDYKSEKWDRTGRQAERREFCDKWLYEQLGKPHNVINGDIEYVFENCMVSCFSNDDIRDAGSAGHVVIHYRR